MGVTDSLIFDVISGQSMYERRTNQSAEVFCLYWILRISTPNF